MDNKETNHIKHTYPRLVWIIANIVLSLAVILAVRCEIPTATDKTSNIVQKSVVNDTDVSTYEAMFNQYRQSQGCEPLVFTDDLNRIATLRLAEIKADFSHNSLGGYNRYLAENIVEGIANNQQALDCWKGSSPHNANMLNTTYKYSGYAAGGRYAVQVFTEWITIDGVPQLPPGWYFP
jgi:uncharacterized protein YkwD